MIRLDSLKTGDRFRCVGRTGTVVLVQLGRVRVKWDAMGEPRTFTTARGETVTVPPAPSFDSIAPGSECEQL